MVIDKNIDDMFMIFNRYKIKAKFFNRGSNVKENPAISKIIASKDHEIAWAVSGHEVSCR